MTFDSKQLTQEALDGFWECLTRRFTDAKTGDLSPLISLRLTQAAESAVNEWVWANVPKRRRKKAVHATPAEFMHTPGPWFVDRTSPHSPLCIKPYPGRIVCDIEGTDKESEANATLIAAAPELLSACRTAVKDIRWLESFCRWDDTTPHPHLKEIEAAIAKATTTESVGRDKAA